MSDVLTAGRLEDQPFPALAGRIFREGRSGGLSLESGGRHRTVWFLGGNPAAVVSDDPEDHIARFLLEHGHVNEEEHARLAALPETRQGFADASFLPKEALNWGVKFRFVNICYDLFRWEEGDYSFTEGNPPRDLFLLKVPAHSLIVKGVGYLGRARLLDLVPDEALLAAGVIDAEQARYLGAAERDVLDACRPGSTVGAVLQSGGGEDPERTRALVYALACLGLVSFAPAIAAAPPAPARPADEVAFTLEEPAADAAAFSLPAPSREEGPFALPPLDDRAGATTGVDLEAALASATGPGRFPFEEEAGGGPLGSFDESFTGESEEQPAPPPRKAPPAKAKAAARRTGGSRLPRLAGIALGAVAASVIVGAAAWWWLGSEEAPPPRPVAPTRPAPPTPAPVPPPPALAPSPAAPAPPAPTPAASIPAAAPPSAAVPVPLPAPPPAAVAPGGGSADRYRSGFDVFRAGDLDGAAAIWEDLLALEQRDAFTLLLLTACQRETIQEAQKTLSARRLYLVPKRVNGRNCFRVCVDTYGSRDEAARALAGLPAEFRAAGASVRPVADVLANR